MTHIKFPSLQLFDNVYSRETYGEGRRTLRFRAKIKLHGTNLGIRVESSGTVTVQTRTRDLDASDDFHQAHEMLSGQLDAFAGAAGPLARIFYGEWAGPGIDKGDAVQQTGAKRFYIFAMGLGEAPHHQDPSITVSRWIVTDPAAIEAALPAGLDRDLVRVLPWGGPSVDMDFAEPLSIDAALAGINAMVERVAVCDPYIRDLFGIEHPGEGYVLVPVSDATGQLSGEEYSRSAFKAKTEKHRVKKQRKAATKREPLPETATAFVETFVTTARLEQAVREAAEGVHDPRRTGAVIAWIVADIEKEGGGEIDALADRPACPSRRLKAEILARRAGLVSRLAARRDRPRSCSSRIGGETDRSEGRASRVASRPLTPPTRRSDMAIDWNAEPVHESLRITLVRGPGVTEPALIETHTAADEYVDLAVLEEMLAEWAGPCEDGGHVTPAYWLPHARAAGFAEAIAAREEDLADGKWTLRLVEVLRRASAERADAIFSEDG